MGPVQQQHPASLLPELALLAPLLRVSLARSKQVEKEQSQQPHTQQREPDLHCCSTARSTHKGRYHPSRHGPLAADLLGIIFVYSTTACCNWVYASNMHRPCCDLALTTYRPRSVRPGAPFSRFSSRFLHHYHGIRFATPPHPEDPDPNTSPPGSSPAVLPFAQSMEVGITIDDGPLCSLRSLRALGQKTNTRKCPDAGLVVAVRQPRGESYWTPGAASGERLGAASPCFASLSTRSSLLGTALLAKFVVRATCSGPPAVVLFSDVTTSLAASTASSFRSSTFTCRCCGFEFSVRVAG